MSTVNNGYILFLYEDLLLIIRISYFSYVIFVVGSYEKSVIYWK